ncbi:hypothetical protein DKX38_012593 [Salix brachista]|uniref:Transglycosylase SLT domain-containing protein n=1 Tax=Salix brachista TaxID=2182728 RepID=A0A5N5LQX0_9ROSI|nr:hypothetical protein DKX38_012593 [Salix brachista]
MAASFYYWNDCVDFQDMEAMWREPEVSTEWLDAGETKGSKVHLSRDPDGEPYLTQTEMKAVADIIVRRHFDSQMHPDMICAIAELESDRQPLSTKWYGKKTKETALGIMQILPKTAEWLVRVRSEEFIVRAYSGGPKKATHKLTLSYWKRYLSVKESLPSRWFVGPSVNIACSSTAPAVPATQNTGVDYIYWDSKASPEDMQEMWSHSEVAKEWTKSGEKRGKVRFSHDGNKRPYLSRVEIKAVADIIRSKHFSTRGVKPVFTYSILPPARANDPIFIWQYENSKEYLVQIDGKVTSIGELASYEVFREEKWVRPPFLINKLVGVDRELGYRAYRVDSVDDMTKPFVSMYFGAAYLAWLSEYEGRERTPQFVVPAYLSGPKNVNHQETGPLWLKFEQALSCYEDTKRDPGNCTIL